MWKKSDFLELGVYFVSVAIWLLLTCSYGYFALKYEKHWAVVSIILVSMVTFIVTWVFFSLRFVVPQRNKERVEDIRARSNEKTEVKFNSELGIAILPEMKLYLLKVDGEGEHVEIGVYDDNNKHIFTVTVSTLHFMEYMTYK